jgi:hypothetical protein
MDENKIVSMEEYKKERELEREWIDEDIPANPIRDLPIMLASAYWRGNLDGKREKWMEIRIHIFTLIFSNLLSLFLLWWALSNVR